MATVGKHMLGLQYFTVEQQQIICHHLWESVLLQLPGWHWGAPRADLEESWQGSKECTFLTHKDI